jgi:hypothetical protein
MSPIKDTLRRTLALEVSETKEDRTERRSNVHDTIVDGKLIYFLETLEMRIFRFMLSNF